ncbi:hypothetical protein ACO0QE_004417 [Hanseniaspora vineae]
MLSKGKQKLALKTVLVSFLLCLTGVLVFQQHRKTTDDEKSQISYNLMNTSRYRDLESFRKEDEDIYGQYVKYLRDPVVSVLLKFKEPQKNYDDTLTESQKAPEHIKNPNVNHFKNTLYNYSDPQNQKYFKFPLHTLNYPYFELKAKQQVLVETNGKQHSQHDYTNGRNCIVFFLSDGGSPDRLMDSIFSFEENWNSKYHYPYVIVTGFYISENFIYERLLTLDIESEITVIRTTDIKNDAFVEGNWDYLVDGYANYLKGGYYKNKDESLNYLINKLYPEAYYPKTGTDRSQDKLMAAYSFIFEEYGTASIEMTNFASYDWMNLEYFKNFDNFFYAKPGMIIREPVEEDLFEGLQTGLNAKFVDFRRSPGFKNILQQQIACDIYSITKNTVSTMFKSVNEMPGEQLNAEKKLEPKADLSKNYRLHTISKHCEDEIFNGLTLSLHSSMFVSKFNIFRSMEYELFFKYMMIMRAAEDDFVSANDIMTLFFALFNAQDGENPAFRQDLKMFLDIDVTLKHNLDKDLSAPFNEFGACPLFHTDDKSESCVGDTRFFMYYVNSEKTSIEFYHFGEAINFVKQQCIKENYESEKCDESLNTLISSNIKGMFK